MIVYRPRETGEDARARPPGSFEYADVYREICRAARRRVLGSDEDAAPGGAEGLLLVTPHVDSLAATRIFTRLLVDDEISYRIVPVNGYRALQRVLAEDIQGHLEVRTVACDANSSFTQSYSSTLVPLSNCRQQFHYHRIACFMCWMRTVRGILVTCLPHHRPTTTFLSGTMVRSKSECSANAKHTRCLSLI